MADFTTAEICHILEIPQRKVISMIERGYFDASISPADGHGSRRVFSVGDLVKAGNAQLLEKIGYKAETIRKWLKT